MTFTPRYIRKEEKLEQRRRERRFVRTQKERAR
jgi:hypothetical protein